MHPLAVILLSFVFGFYPPEAYSDQGGHGPANAVDGLELPADQTVSADEGFLSLAAKTDATEIRWIVFGSGKIKYVELDKAVIVSVPSEGTITVFAVGLLKEHLTPAARTIITVQGARPPPPGPDPGPSPNPGPGPGPGPGPKPTPGNGKLHITLVLDYDKMTPALAGLVNNATLRRSISDAGDVLRVYPVTSTVLTTRRLTDFVSKAGGPPAIIIQSDDGKVRASEKMPADAAAVQALIQRVKNGS